VALARLAKKKGFKVALFGGPALLTTRMYTGWTTLWPGISKNLVEMLGGTGPALLTAAASLILAWAAPIMPLLDAYACSSSAPDGCLALFAAVPASAAAFAFHLCGAAYFRVPLWYGSIFPLGYALGAALAVDSIRRRLSGKVSWKGRIYQ
jgi:chlorobactene glucosyltransferase